jgi:hypothetical protein
MGLLPTNVIAGNTGHIANSNQVHGKLNDFPNIVRDYGADPTGVADSYSAVAAAISDTPSSGGPLVCPPGIFDFGTTIDLTSRPAIWLIGAKAASHNDTMGTVFRTRTNGMTLMKVGTGALIHTGPTIDGLHFQSKTGQTGYTLTEIDTVNRWRLDRCAWDAADPNTGTGLLIQSSEDNAWWQILQPLLRNLATGIQIDDTVGGTIIGGGIIGAANDTSVCLNATAATQVNIFGLFFDGGGWQVKGLWTDSHFVGCKFENPRGAGAGMEFTGVSRRNMIVGCNVSGDGSTTGPGLVFGASASDNYYAITTENMGAAPSITDNAGRNIGVLVTGGASQTRVEHHGGATPTTALMAHSGCIAVGTNKIWVNDAGTIKSVAIA